MILRVLLTGGPHSGKTTVARLLQRHIERLGAPVVLVPEAATQVIQAAGTTIDTLQRERLVFLQSLIMHVQYANEVTYESLAVTLQRLTLPSRPHFAPVVMIFDRSVLDGRAFVSEQDWDSVLKLTEVKVEDTTTFRAEGMCSWDLVIHLQSTACVSDSQYEMASPSTDTFRIQTSGDAAEIDAVLASIYAEHPCFRSVPFCPDFGVKVDSVLGLVGHALHPFTSTASCMHCGRLPPDIVYDDTVQEGDIVGPPDT